MADSDADSKRQLRRHEILIATQEVLSEKGYKKTSMLDIARRAGASKETLYSWFGDKQGLFSSLINHNSILVQQTLTETLPKEVAGEPTAVLTLFAETLLRLLTGKESIALNRAAITEAPHDITLSLTLVSHGRGTVVPLLAERLSFFHQTGQLHIPDPGTAAEIFLGLIMTDIQHRCLLGVRPAPEEDEIKHRVQYGVQHFIRIYSPDNGGDPA